MVLPKALTGDCRQLGGAFAELGMWLSGTGTPDSSRQPAAVSEDCRRRLGWDGDCEAEFGRFVAADSAVRGLPFF